ncbi:MAG: ABC transporter permease [Eubacteriales bacterium]|nr:ABC transporter permease [Eubacteriales bacterium]
MIRFEIKKIFSKTVNKIGLVVLLAALIVTCYFAISSMSYVDEAGNTHVGITAARNLRDKKLEWTGVLTEDVFQEVIRQNRLVNEAYPNDPADIQKSEIGYSKKQGFSDIRDLINSGFSDFREYNYYRADSVSEDEVGRVYENRTLNLEKWLNSEEAKDKFSEKEKTFLISQYEKLKTPIYYKYMGGWDAALKYATTIIMLAVLILSFFVSGIFSNEFQWKSDSVFFSARYGRDKGVLSKIAAGLTVITGIYWLVMLVYSVVILSVAGVDGANCVIQTGWTFWKSFYNITYLQAYLLTVVGGYVGALFILSVSMLVSAKTHTIVLAVTIPFVLIFIQSFLGGFTALSDVLGLLPDQLLQINMAIKTFNLYEIGGKVVGSVPIILTVYSILFCAILPVLYLVYRKTEIK